MRLNTFHTFAVTALAQAPDVHTVEAWDRGAEHLRGLHITFSTGSQVWLGITAAAAPGDKWEGPEVPVEGEPPAEVAYPQLYVDGTVTPARAQEYLAAAITNAGSKEVQHAYGYSSETKHPGFGVIFHDQARAFCLFHHTARAGQAIGGRELQAAF